MFLFLALIAAAAGPHLSFAGFGVSPGTLEEKRLVPGSHLERTVYLVQGAPEKDLTIEATVESAEIGGWMSFKEGERFVIPAGVQQFPVTVIIDVPEDASLGEYHGFIRVKTVPERVEDSQVTIALGGRIDVDLTVGDDIVSDFDIKSITIADVKEGEDPEANVTITNTGNVPVAPESATFELFNKYGDIRLGFAENTTFEKVEAFSEDVVALTFPIDITLAPGEYWGHIKIYDDGKVVKELKTVFNVTPRSTLEKLAVPGIAIVVLVAGGALLVVRMRARKRMS